MALAVLSDTELRSVNRKLSGMGATEEQVDMRDTVAQRIDKIGTKLEDIAGNGEIDSSGG